MEIHTNISIKNLTTMHLGGMARFVADIYSIDDAITACKNAKNQNIPIFVLGGGSNVIGRDEWFGGIILIVKIPGFEILNDSPESTTIKIGGGEDWDSIVKQTVDMGLTGIEAMSAIPGTAGAAPVQNVGAYGQEIADVFQSLEAYDINTEKMVTLQKSDCGFGYRDSIFKKEAKGRYVITSITIKLSKSLPKPPFYSALQKFLDGNNITTYNPETIRNAVIRIRQDKLPDPKTMPSCGSFFKNVVIDEQQYNKLLTDNLDMPSFDMGDKKYKIPAGWLIEKAGFKGKLIDGIRVYEKNALVLVNESANSYNDLAQARDQITNKVYELFQIRLEQEPLEIE